MNALYNEHKFSENRFSIILFRNAEIVKAFLELPPGSRSQYGISNEELAPKYSQYKIKAKSGMDMLGFLRLRAWDATREQEKKKPQQRFIDEDCALFLFRHLFRHAGINREAVKFRMS